MRNMTRSALFLCLTALAISMTLLGCGGSSSSGGNGQTVTGSTIISGNVLGVVTAKGAEKNNTSFLALIKDFLTPTEIAEAVGSDSEGILVTVLVNGEIAGSDITDSEGNFELTLTGGGNVTLTFATAEFTTSIDIFVPEDGTVNLVVTLEPEDVVVEESETEFAGTITEISCPLITIDGSIIVDTTSAFTEVGDGETDTPTSCEELEVGTPVEVKGEIDLLTGVVIAGSIEINSDDGGMDDGDDSGDGGGMDGGGDCGDGSGIDCGDDSGDDGGMDGGGDSGDDGGMDGGDDSGMSGTM